MTANRIRALIGNNGLGAEKTAYKVLGKSFGDSGRVNIRHRYRKEDRPNPFEVSKGPRTECRSFFAKFNKVPKIRFQRGCLRNLCSRLHAAALVCALKASEARQPAAAMWTLPSSLMRRTPGPGELA